MKEKATKLNLGAGSAWTPLPGWCVVDHHVGLLGTSQAWNIPYPDKSFDTVYSSHMIEHISHFKIEEVVCEINRVMQVGGVLRLMTPHLRKLATAYVNNDVETMKHFIEEDGGDIRMDLGLGQAFMGFITSPGYDNFLCDSEMSRPIAGYAHVYCYDFQMLSGLLAYYGFGEIRECDADDTVIADHRKLRTLKYDRDKDHSLIVECRKVKDVKFDVKKSVIYTGPYDIPKIPKRARSLLTRAAMLATSTVEGVAYRLAKKVLRPDPRSAALHPANEAT